MGIWCQALLGVFVVASVAAAWTYPGGSALDPQAQAFAPLRNYWCDLLDPVTPNGRANDTAALLARLAFAALGVSLGLFWHLAASLGPPTLRARLVRVCGMLSAVGVCVVAWMPTEVDNLGSTLIKLTAGAAGGVAALAALVGDRAPGPDSRWRRRWGFAFALATLVNLAVYVDIDLNDRGASVVLPVAQMVGVVLLVLWMVATVREARWRAGSRAASGGPTFVSRDGC